MVLAYFLHLVYLCDICDEIAKTFVQLVLFLCDTCCLSQSISTISCSLSDMCDAFDVFEVHTHLEGCGASYPVDYVTEKTQ